MRLASK
jgi:hypothetical protein